MKLTELHRKAVKHVLPFIEKGNFYLAGGTAVYYYLRHRKSLDLDFFTQKNFNFLQHQYLLHPHKIVYQSSDTIHAEVEGVKVSFFHYPYKLLKPLNTIDGVPIAHLEDILCMKINAIINRGCRRDFIDVYFTLKELSLTPEKVIELFQEKFGAYNPLVICKALTHFEDAEKDPEPEMLKPVSWKEVKDFFIKNFGSFKKISKKSPSL
jgi:predicted nucleotidyltransferase component of viral defense system